VTKAELTAAGKPEARSLFFHRADGKVKGEEETVPSRQVPEVVRKAIESQIEGCENSRVQRIKEDGILPTRRPMC